MASWDWTVWAPGQAQQLITGCWAELQLLSGQIVVLSCFCFRAGNERNSWRHEQQMAQKSQQNMAKNMPKTQREKRVSTSMAKGKWVPNLTGRFSATFHNVAEKIYLIWLVVWI